MTTYTVFIQDCALPNYSIIAPDASNEMFLCIGLEGETQSFVLQDPFLFTP